MIASNLGGDSRFRSLQIGVAQESFGESMQRNMSWSGYERALPPEMIPQRLFDRLFGSREPYWIERKKSILDAVTAEARTLKNALGGGDRQRLDEYLASVRSLERSIASLPRSDQRRWGEIYVQGLVTVPGRKSIRRIAEHVVGERVDQGLQQFVNQSPWSSSAVRLDIAHGVDYLRTLAPKYGLDLNRVVVSGHSAGGHLALWAAARRKISSKSELYVRDPLPFAQSSGSRRFRTSRHSRLPEPAARRWIS